MIACYIGLLANAERALADALALIGLRHAVEPEIRSAARTYAAWCRAHVDALGPAIDRYGASRNTDGERLRRALFRGPRLGGFGLLRDLHDLVTLATAVREGWTALHQAAREAHDHELAERSRACGEQTARMIAWLDTKVRHSAPQALTVPADTPTELRASVPSLAQLSAAAGPAARAILHRLVPVRPSALAVAVALALGVAIARRAGVSRAAAR